MICVDRDGNALGKAIVWLDLPWAAREVEFAEVGPANGKPRYTNPKEVEALGDFLRELRQESDCSAPSPSLSLAVLSPYNQQVALISRTLKEASSTWPGLVLKQALRSRTRGSDAGAPVRVAHTVDSFQGNQADVIAVSLVRNNSFPVGEGLGFLDEAPRINVLLSRAERLLVLVGSWEFFEHQLGAVPLDDPQLPLWHWKKVLATLNEWFASGRALRLSVGLVQRGGAS